MRTVKAILVDPTVITITGIEFTPSLQEFYRLLNCEQIEGTYLFTLEVTTTVVGELPNFFADEETGLIPATISPNWSYPICGPFIVTGPIDREGEYTSIKDEDVAAIANEIRATKVCPFLEGFPLLGRSKYVYQPL